VPDIAAPRRLSDAADAPEVPEDAVHIFLEPGATGRVRDVAAEASAVCVWIGPEGGFTQDESTRLSRFATAVSVGPRILRSETAGIVSVALVQEHTGNLNV
jgi:16S rRNA (uracil1498-N3)-methyltransferase